MKSGILALFTALLSMNGFAKVVLGNEEISRVMDTDTFQTIGIDVPDLEAEIFRSEYYAGIAFRETPYADILGTRPLPKEMALGVNHFQFDYDKDGRLVRTRYMLNGKVKPFDSRFVRAPQIHISYKDTLETRVFYNEHGQRMTVSGDVYTSVFVIDKDGYRKSLDFYDVNGNKIENDFKIANYQWETGKDGTVIEKRYDGSGNLQRNRPGFGYYITKFTYDHRGLLRLMTNLGKSGEMETPDEAGVVHTRIGYDNNKFFINWLNLDSEHRPRRGMSNIAEISYEPAPLFEHSSATFIDADGSPQTTNWGAHIVLYTFDEFGNTTSRRYLDKNKNPGNASNGMGMAKYRYTDDGIYESHRSYYDKDGKAICLTGTEIHQINHDFDDKGRPVQKSFQNINGEVVRAPAVGYAIEKWIYDDLNRLAERQFLDEQENLIDHIEWGVARFVYSYNNEELRAVKYLDADGNSKSINWNPNH